MAEDACPTGMLVDLNPASTPGRKTPRRTCRTPKTAQKTPKTAVKTPKNGQKTPKTGVKTPKRGARTPKDNSQESPVVPEITDGEPKESVRRDVIATPEFPLEMCLLDEEKFDFDLPISPGSQDEDVEEEIFFGPVGFKEKCIHVAVESECPHEPPPLTPLTANEMVLLFKEAQTVAFHIKAKGTPMKSSQSSQSSVGSTGYSSQGTKRKLDMLDTEFPSPKVQVQEDSTPKNTRISDNILSKTVTKSKVCTTTKAIITTPKRGVPTMHKSKLEVGVKSSRTHSTSDSVTPGSRNTSIAPSGRATASGTPNRLQRASSVRLPKTRLPNTSVSSKENQRGPVGRTRHISIKDQSTGSSPVSSHRPSPTTKLNSSLCEPGQRKLQRPTARGSGLVRPGSSLARTGSGRGQAPRSTDDQTDTLTRKPSLLRGGMTRPELMKPGTLQRKSATSSCLPRGPLKATAPVKAQVSESSRGASSMTTPRTVLSRVNSNTPAGRGTSSPRRHSTLPAPTSTTKAIITTPSSIPGKRRSCIPSPRKALSCSFRSSTSSTDSVFDSPVAEPTPKNTSRLRRSMPSGVSNVDASTTSRRAIPSPGTRLASKLQPLKINKK